MKIEDREDGMSLILEKNDLVELKNHFQNSEFASVTQAYTYVTAVSSTYYKHNIVESNDSVMKKIERLVKLCV